MRNRLQIFSIVLLCALIGALVITKTYAAINLDEVELAGFNNVNQFYPSNRYTYPELDATAVSPVSLDMGDDVVKITTEIGDVYLDQTNLSFQFINSNGYVWSSTVDYDNESNGLNAYLKRSVRSAVILRAFNTRSSTYNIVTELVSDASINITMITNGFNATITFNTSKISIDLRVTFTNQGIDVTIPASSIKEEGNFLLYDLSVYPYFGGVLEDNVPGYIFIPDGVGALVRYKKAQSTIQGNYEKKVYGRDLGYSVQNNLNLETTQDAAIYAPVFGFVHGVNQNAMFSIIEAGGEYSSLNIEYSGKLTRYSTIYPRFTFRQVYYQPIDKAGNTISLLQTSMNPCDIKLKYLSLTNEDANYIGMANCYREYISENDNMVVKEKVDNVPLRLETIGLEKTTGVLFDQTIVMTTFTDYADILSDLNNKGITNILGVYSGFSRNGVSWSSPNYGNYSNRLGTKSELENLVNNNSIYFSVDVLKGNSKSSGYNIYSDLAKKINDQQYTYEESNYTTNLLKPRVGKEIFSSIVSDLGNLGIENFNVLSMGNLLYSDYSEGSYLKDTINIYKETLASSNGKIALSDANDYLWSSMTDYFDFPMYSSQYLYFDDTVPFLSTVLSPMINLYSSNANFYAYPREELLRLIDFNVYPSFVVTKESSQKLQETNLNYIYSSRYDDLQQAIVKYYDFINQPLKMVSGATITNRYIPEVGVSINSYSNGVTIIINYTNMPIQTNGHRVEAMNYLVIGGE